LGEFVCNHVVWAPFVILRAIEGMVTVDVVSLVALTFEFVWEYWDSQFPSHVECKWNRRELVGNLESAHSCNGVGCSR
jgi:hypothetical protein